MAVDGAQKPEHYLRFEKETTIGFRIVTALKDREWTRFQGHRPIRICVPVGRKEPDRGAIAYRFFLSR
jgi:hypothetical protein